MLNPNENKKIQEIDPITSIRWHTQAITSIQFEPREDSVLAVCSADNKLTLWDFSVDIEDQETKDQVNDLKAQGLDIPPQLMFLHQGQNNIKELCFHPQYRTLLFTTAEDSFNVFRPNLDPDDVSEGDNEMKEESKETDKKKLKRAEYAVESDEDFEEEERRIMRTAKQLNKNIKNRSHSKNKAKRTRKD